ncbi:MAG: methionine adenosyltransferase domain-containing protein [Candidatus Paceibacterota bacterium]|jgi:S-adenosylmethionine synthetase|nr:methionine adenosyltransferase domain-containing protein [Candidatus Paceibacterota bacterium]MDD4875093.1 methionine adenosyltransferase domain-containing protein [Candidatus Paceibacterota bacterium]
MTTIKTCEFVSPKHPDKLCDYIADVLLDSYMAVDPKSRVAIEIMGGHNNISVSGEVTSKAKVNVENIIKSILGEKYNVKIYLSLQSPSISRGVDSGGAGDQGIMIGYAAGETKNFMPLEYELARNLCGKIYKQFPFDGKTQVTVENGKIKTVVASFQKISSAELEKLVRELIKAEEYLINPTGEWEMGGLDADSGLSGRKIVIDNYGPEIGIGGGSFSGKDWTKVDRSGAYMARRIAVDLLKKRGAKSVKTKLAYAIGKKEPVMAVAELDGKEEKIKGYDLSPKGIYEFLNLGEIKFRKTASWGHFGREFPWG